MARPTRVLRLQSGLARARQSAQLIIEPASNEIQIDLDSSRALLTFAAQLSMFRRYKVARGWRCYIRGSFTRGHAHVTIRLPRSRPLIERVMLAALLGSDLKREGFNYVRILTGRRRRFPVAFFERQKP